MSERWAMIENGVVVNVCLWDGNLNTWQPPEGIEMQLASEQCGIGWLWDGEQFNPPEAT